MDWARASLWGGKALGLALALLCLTRSIEPDGPAAWGIAAGGVLLILWGGVSAVTTQEAIRELQNIRQYCAAKSIPAVDFALKVLREKLEQEEKQ